MVLTARRSARVTLLAALAVGSVALSAFHASPAESHPGWVSVASVASGLTSLVWLLNVVRALVIPRARIASYVHSLTACALVLGLVVVGYRETCPLTHNAWILTSGLSLFAASAWPELLAIELARDRWPASRERAWLLLVIASVQVFAVNALLFTVRVMPSVLDAALVSGAIAGLQVFFCWVLVRELGSRREGADALIERLRAEKERRWIDARRAQAGVSPRDAAVGLCLSGGGIRSAAICLGFLERLAERGLLAEVDYLSTVSGGGWAGGAMSARAQSLRGAHKVTDARFWRALVADFRARRAYLLTADASGVGGGVRIVIMLLTGAIANAVPFLLAAFGGMSLVALMSRAENPVAPLVRHTVACLQPAFGFLYPFGRETPDLYVLNLIPLLAGVFFGAAALFLLGVLFGYTTLAPDRMPRVALRLFGTSVLLGCACALVSLFLQGSQVVTVLALAALVGAIVSRWIQRISWESFAAAIVGVVTGQQSIPGIKAIVGDLTMWWSEALRGALLIPPRALHALVQDENLQLLVPFIPLSLAGAAAVYIDRNRTGLHGFWTQRIADAFLRERVGEGETPGADRALCELDVRGGAPLPILSCAVNIPGSRDASHRGRGTDHFELTPHVVGSQATGWTLAEHYGAGITLADAVGVSAAAVNTQGGSVIPRALRMLFTVLNLRLGYWIRNPGDADDRLRFRKWLRLWSVHSTMEFLGMNSEEDSMVLVSDGGHHDNLGLLSLARRRVPLVVCVDAGADPEHTFADLGQSLHLLREEGWNNAGFDVGPMCPSRASSRWEDRIVSAPVQVLELVNRDDQARMRVVLVKSSMTQDIPFDVRSYAESNPLFPHETTADQFFDVVQFDAYYVNGRHLADRAEPVVNQEFDALTRPATVAP